MDDFIGGNGMTSVSPWDDVVSEGEPSLGWRVTSHNVSMTNLAPSFPVGHVHTSLVIYELREKCLPPGAFVGSRGVPRPVYRLLLRHSTPLLSISPLSRNEDAKSLEGRGGELEEELGQENEDLECVSVKVET